MNLNYLKPPVYYLKRNIFNSNGEFKNISFFKNKLTIIFIHGDFCGYCKMAKPEFQKAADLNKNENVLFTSIQIDGTEEGEKECYDILDKILINFSGFPDYAVFYNNVPVFKQIPGRDYKSILQFTEDFLKENPSYY